MAEPTWNWESKVERLRQILEKQALERTYDVCESARSTDFVSIENISVEAESLNSSEITTVSDEQLINLINYNEFLSFSLSPKHSSSGSMQTCLPIASPTQSGTPSPTPSLPPPPTPIPSSSLSASIASIPANSMTIKTNENLKPAPKKHDVSCNTSRTSILHSPRDFCTHYEGANWIPMLEVAKSDFIKLIDQHINAIREKAEQTQSKQYEWLHAIQMTQARKIIARKSCVRRIRDEFAKKMITFQNLLDQLENI